MSTLEWDSVAQLGNLMRHMIKGYIYDNQAAEVGYQKTGVVPLEEAELPQLLEHICSKSISAPTRAITAHQESFGLQPVVAVLLRELNAGGVRLDIIVLPTKGSTLPYLLHGQARQESRS